MRHLSKDGHLSKDVAEDSESSIFYMIYQMLHIVREETDSLAIA
jgi:hypothetical protein